ncbi:MAG: MerR family transcriptional regulator [Desulfobulbaceae bacterium]|nr:MerR family transcriptional regulator [Desulfobulbaceae bacterium]
MIYKIGTLAKKTGFSPNLIRVWEQRYGFLSPTRGQGKQRLFSEDDLSILCYLRKELSRGRSIGELAVLGRENLLRDARIWAAAQKTISQSKDIGLAKASEPAIQELIIKLVQAAFRVDSSTFKQVLNYAFSCFNPGDVINKIISPAMVEIGKSWKEGRLSIAGEHMASMVIEQKISSLLAIAQVYPQTSSDFHVALCACFPGENHRMGILNVAYHLASQGMTVVFLGNDLPFKDLEFAIANINPQSVWLSVTQPSVYRRHHKELGNLVHRLKPIHFIVGGQALSRENKTLHEAGCRQCLQPFILPDDLMKLPFFGHSQNKEKIT